MTRRCLQVLKHVILSAVANAIRNELYYATSSHGHVIFFGQVSIETALIDIDYDAQGFTISRGKA